jgi:hypothetical protein
VASVTRNPQGLFETRLAQERERVRATPVVPGETTVFSHIPAIAFSRFVAAVRRYDDEPVLRYSQRCSLLKIAERLGIRRFDANLIIASIERDRTIQTSPEATKRSTWAVWSIALAIQFMLIAGAWWVITV